MSVFGSIMSKIFHHPAAAPAASPAAPPAPTDATAPTPPVPTSAQPPSAAFDETAAPATPAQPGAAAMPAQSVDVGAVLADMDAKSGQKLNYKTSIVDLMKLLGLDSSLENRKTLATELHYTGDANDSAAMNVWLHKQVMDQLAANGGTVPADLRA